MIPTTQTVFRSSGWTGPDVSPVEKYSQPDMKSRVVVGSRV